LFIAREREMMKRVLAGLFAAVMIAVAGCDGDSLEEGGCFEVKLRGTWETRNPAPNIVLLPKKN
jgi:hypothetical protein